MKSIYLEKLIRKTSRLKECISFKGKHSEGKQCQSVYERGKKLLKQKNHVRITNNEPITQENNEMKTFQPTHIYQCNIWRKDLGWISTKDQQFKKSTKCRISIPKYPFLWFIQHIQEEIRKANIDIKTRFYAQLNGGFVKNATSEEILQNKSRFEFSWRQFQQQKQQ